MERNNTYLSQQNLYSNLLIILQSIKCHITNAQCKHLNCHQFINFFDHIRNCDKAEDCNLEMCSQTVTYMRHYLNCSTIGCGCMEFGEKSLNNRIFVEVKNILLRNQFMIWRRKINPFRPHLLWKISDELASFTKEPNSKDIIYRFINQFDQENFYKSKGIIIYLNNFATNANDILNKIQWKHFRGKNPNLTYQDYIRQVDEKANIQKIFNYLKRYSTDVLHNRIRLEPPPVETKHEDIKPVEIKLAEVKSEVESVEMKSVEMKSVEMKEDNEVKSEDAKSECEVKFESESHSPTNSSSLTPPKSVSSLKTSPEVLVEDKFVKNEKIWTASELRYLFIAFHKKICQEKDAEIFLQPVDWVHLEIPDYPKIITRPMDLSTIEAKLDSGEYAEPWDVLADYWLMFNNAWTYNKKNSKIYKMCSSLVRIFEAESDELMQSIGLCCGREYVFLPQVLICCTPQMCMVNRDAVYYSINNEEQDENGKKLVPELGCDKYVCCEKCFNNSVDTNSVQMMVSESSNALVSVEKSLFSKLKNNVKEKEEFVKCKICHKKWHKVCAHHIDEIWGSGFYCPECESNRPQTKQKNVLISANLPHCNLSQHLEARIDAWRQKESQSVSKINIRVLSISNKNAEIKPEMKRIFVENGEMPENLPYKLKAIFAFQEQPDGSEICLFGMHTQEYGSDCPSPNSRRVYLAYLDSVNFFEPANLRTEFYHRLLISYLEYCRQLGFIFAHIWACPPGEGDDYIFHMHPQTQKLPKPKRLQEWYIAMLDKAVKDGIVVEYSDIFAYAFNSQLTSASEMPYFEGDYWPNIIEDLLKEDNLNLDALADDDSKLNESLEFVEVSQSKKRKLKKIPISNNSKRRRQSDLTDGCNDIMRRLFDLLERRKENFFVIRLHNQSDASRLPEIEDKDVIKFSDLMDGRDKFLSLSREKHLEFSSVRRAKFATLVLCYELHLELRHGVIYSCDNCDLKLDEVRFTCQECEEFELCESCVSKKKHPHKLHRIPSLETENNSNGKISNGNATTASIDQRALELKRQESFIMVYEHANKCRDVSCKFPNCNRWKNIVDHNINCIKRNDNACIYCTRILGVMQRHVNICKNSNCHLEICLAKRLRRMNQTRLLNLASDRRRMQSATANVSRVMTPITQEKSPQMNVAIQSPQIDPNTYNSDICTIRTFIEQLKQNSTFSEEDIQRRFVQFLHSNPRYKEVWKNHIQRQQVNHQSQNGQRFPPNAQMRPPQYYQTPQSRQQNAQVNSLSQQQIIQHQIMQNQNPRPQSIPSNTQPYYVVQTRQPFTQPNQMSYYNPTNNQIQFQQQQQQHSTFINNTQFQNFNPS